MIFRHENFVLNKPIQIVLEDENVLVVNKPCSIPVRYVLCFYVHNIKVFYAPVRGKGICTLNTKSI